MVNLVFFLSAEKVSTRRQPEETLAKLANSILQDALKHIEHKKPATDPSVWKDRWPVQDLVFSAS